MESPKKASNPIGIESQWSLGWQGNSKDVFNRPNNSKGIHRSIQDLTIITTKATSYSETPATEPGQKRRPKEVIRKRKKSLISQSGTTTPRTPGRPPWCWETISQTTVKKTKSTKLEPLPHLPTQGKNDLIPYLSIFTCGSRVIFPLNILLSNTIAK